ncbi:MAG: M20/M25/M40 family metallo-hydrolase [Candidatus Micrarchaeia archaeon]
MLNILEELVRINSTFPNEQDIGEYLFYALKERGFEVEKQLVEKNRYNILGIKGRGNKRKIGFYAHMDTIPVQGNWEKDPFKLKIENNKAIGLGAYDMKAGISLILELANSNLDCELKIAFGCDEENNSLGAQKLLEKEFFKGCDLVIVPEINDSPMQKEGTILLGRRGRIRYEIEVLGQSCHGASGDGVNAITQASKLILEIEKMEQTIGKNMQGSQFISAVNSKAKSLSYPEICNLEVDVHLTNEENENIFIQRINKIIKELNISANIKIQKREVPYLMPYWTDKNNSEIQKLSKILENKFGQVNYSYGKSVADECIIAKMAPVISIGPNGGNAHKKEEWVDIESLENLKNTLKIYLE